MSAVIYTNDFNEKVSYNSTPINDNNIPENCLDGSTQTFWELASRVQNNGFFDIDAGQSVQYDYFAVSGHNFKDASTQFSQLVLYGSDDSLFNPSTVLSVITPVNEIANDINMDNNLTPGTFRYYRIIISFIDAQQTTLLKVSNIFIGFKTQMEGITSPYTPPKLSRQAEIKNNKTMAGNFVGRSLENQQYDFIIKQNNISQQWMVDNWLPVVNVIQEKTFMFLWDDSDLSSMVFCWTKGPIENVVYDNQLYASFLIPCNGFIEYE